MALSTHDDLIDRVLVEKNETKRRLMLQLLLRQPFEEESLRSDFIDFCIAKITACSQPYAIRCYCMKLAYEQMKYYPELLEELKMALDMLKQEVLSPGMLSAKRQIIKSSEALEIRENEVYKRKSIQKDVNCSADLQFAGIVAACKNTLHSSPEVHKYL